MKEVLGRYQRHEFKSVSQMVGQCVKRYISQAKKASEREALNAKAVEKRCAPASKRCSAAIPHKSKDR